jgi:intein/homing endonuclease
MEGFFVVYLTMMSLSILYTLDVWIIKRERGRVRKWIKDGKKGNILLFLRAFAGGGGKIRHLPPHIFLEKKSK